MSSSMYLVTADTVGVYLCHKLQPPITSHNSSKTVVIITAATDQPCAGGVSQCPDVLYITHRKVYELPQSRPSNKMT